MINLNPWRTIRDLRAKFRAQDLTIEGLLAEGARLSDRLSDRLRVSDGDRKVLQLANEMFSQHNAKLAEKVQKLETTVAQNEDSTRELIEQLRVSQEDVKTLLDDRKTLLATNDTFKKQNAKLTSDVFDMRMALGAAQDAAVAPSSPEPAPTSPTPDAPAKGLRKTKRDALQP